jgi:hypothetical protein
LSWTQTFVPLVFGVDAWVLPAHGERIFAGLLSQTLLVAFVVGTVLRKRSAWRAWVLIGSTFLVSAALVGATRAGTYGAGDASDVKYVALDAFFLVIAVGFAFLPVRPLSSSPTVIVQAESADSQNPTATARPAWFRTLIVLTVLAVLVVYVTALLFDQNRDSESVGSHASHDYFANFSASWPSGTAATSHAFLWNTEINPRVVTPTFYPYDTASLTVGRLHPEIRFDEWGGTGYLLRSDGSVVRATAVTQARGLVGDRTACANPRRGAGKVVVTLDHPLNMAKQWFGLVSFQSATGAVATQSDGAIVVFPKGGGTLITSFPPAPLSSVVWSLQPGASVCITGLRVVLPEPLGAQVHPAPSP